MPDQFILHFSKCRTRIREQMHTAKAQMPGVPPHKEERDGARPALGRVHPVAGPWIFGNIAFTAVPDIEAVERVIQNWQPDSEKLESNNKRKTAQELDLFRICAGAFGREGVRNEMLDEKQANGYDPCQRMQTAPEKRMSLPSPQRSYAGFDCVSCRTWSRCQRTSLQVQR